MKTCEVCQKNKPYKEDICIDCNVKILYGYACEKIEMQKAELDKLMKDFETLKDNPTIEGLDALERFLEV